MFNSFFYGGKSRGPFRFLRLLLHLPNFVRLTWRLFIDARVPIYRKAILILTELLAILFAIAYLVNPLDFDFLPVFGRIDDLLIGAFVPGTPILVRARGCLFGYAQRILPVNMWIGFRVKSERISSHMKHFLEAPFFLNFFATFFSNRCVFRT